LKAYLDNNVVSAIVKDDTPSESDALDALLVAFESGKIQLVTSELTLQEIKKYEGSHRKGVERVFRLLAKVEIVRWDTLLGMHTYGDARSWISAPLIANDSLYDGLLKLGLDPVDAQHLYVAAKQRCAVFVTCDGGILGRSNEIKTLCGLVVERPSALTAAQAW
jgi:predicted nucleic acid-binding protein